MEYAKLKKQPAVWWVLKETYSMQEQTFSALGGISLIRSKNTIVTKGGFVPTIEGSLPEMGTTDTQERSTESGLDDFKKQILSTYHKVGEFNLKKLKVETLETGFPCLDKRQVFKLGRPQLITLGAHTSHGKSALMMQIAAHVSKAHNVFVHSFEMTEEELESRLLLAVTGIPASLVVEGSREFARIQEAKNDYKNRKLYICKNQNRSLGHICSSIWEMSQIVGPPALIVLDYLQQMKTGGNSMGNRVSEVTDISAACLDLAQRLKCNVLVGAQLNNEVLRRAWSEKDPDTGFMEYTPIISDIRESSSIAHDSAAVLMVVRPHVFDKKQDASKATLYCIKDRHGGLWDQELDWEGKECSFYENKKVGI